MKRLILFLMLFYSTYSSGEKLTKEQQKTAWKFIYKSMLWNFQNQHYDRPNIFTEDIKINLEGRISSRDSVYVKNLIRDIKKAVPHKEISLCDSEGNLVIKGGVKEYNTVVVGTTKEGSRMSYATCFPDNLCQLEMEKFLYFHLFHGLVGHRYISKPIPEMKGCVFNVTDFDSITFSPFDFFILEKIYSPDFSIQLALNLEPDLKQTAWNSIRDKFLGDRKSPIIYKDDIAIQLKGAFSLNDSLVVDEIVDQLRFIIPNRKIYLTTKKPNLVLDFDSLNAPTQTYSTLTWDAITFHKISIKDKIPDYSGRDRMITTVNSRLREKYLYHSLFRTLVEFAPSPTDQTKISGCVFDEMSPERITFHPFDAFILNTLYANDFKEQFREQYVRQSSYRSYLVYMYQKQLEAFFFLLAIILTGMLIIRIIVKGIFKPHNWKWREYNKQGIFIAGVVAIFLFINSFSDLRILTRPVFLIMYVVQVFFSINLIFFIERSIFKKRDFGGGKVILIFIITLGVLSSFFLISFVSISTQSQLETEIVSSQLSISIIIAISLGRSIYIFLNDRHKSIIHKKDVELAKLSNQQKQAELQSLRAKINPHFLYNSLNSIASLSSSDPQKTEQMALALSDFFKYAINREQKQFNSLSEELKAVKTYLEIEKVRFGNRLNFKIDCPEALVGIQIPQFLIQPLVENAIKHGLSKIVDDGLIRIAVTKTGDQLRIRVYDNGPAFPDGPLTGFGLRNTQERIRLLYGNKASVSWRNEDEKLIELILPVTK